MSERETDVLKAYELLIQQFRSSWVLRHSCKEHWLLARTHLKGLWYLHAEACKAAMMMDFAN